MVAYSFQPQFIDPILSGRKRQTVRATGKRRHAKPKEELQLYTGMRTKKCRLIGRATCLEVCSIRIRFAPYRADSIKIGGRLMVRLDDFARSDGFMDWDDLRRFWEKHHPGVRAFRGWLIRWEGFQPAA